MPEVYVVSGIHPQTHDACTIAVLTDITKALELIRKTTELGHNHKLQPFTVDEDIDTVLAREDERAGFDNDDEDDDDEDEDEDGEGDDEDEH
jgi:hypothetical protein